MFEMNDEQRGLFEKLTPLQKEIALNSIAGMNDIDSYKNSSGKAKTENAMRASVAQILSREDLKLLVQSIRAEAVKEACNSGFVEIENDLFVILEELNIDIKAFVSDAVKIKLSSYGVRKRRRVPVHSSARYAVFEKAGFKCQCCGDRPSKENNVVLHVDHIIPFMEGGSNEMSNLQCLCSRCNISKSNNFFVDHNEGWSDE